MNKLFKLITLMKDGAGNRFECPIENEDGSLIWTAEEITLFFDTIRNASVPDNPIVKDQQFFLEFESGMKVGAVEMQTSMSVIRRINMQKAGRQK